MNIFALSNDPKEAAKLQCDRHVVKMVVESAQMLSTTHRILDGVLEKRPSKSGKRVVEYWSHPDSHLEEVLYKVVHKHHPCTVWTMNNSKNYEWHWQHFSALCDEYTFRYGKIHKTDFLLREILKETPKNMDTSKDKISRMALAMGANPECKDYSDIVGSYRKFYQTKQLRFNMTWTKREVPEWFKKQDAY